MTPESESDSDSGQKRAQDFVEWKAHGEDGGNGGGGEGSCMPVPVRYFSSLFVMRLFKKMLEESKLTEIYPFRLFQSWLYQFLF